METYDLGILAKPKPLNGSIRIFARLIISVRLIDVPKMVGIGSMRAARQTGEI
jgi:hypothetical protein